MTNNHFDVLIAGGGPAGYTAALYTARSGYRVAVVEKLSPGGQMAATEVVENYPGFDEGIDGFELGERMRRGAEKYGAVTLFEEIESVELAAEPKIIKTSGGVMTAGAVIVATGAHPRMLGLPGEKELLGRGVAYCATCEGMQFKGKTVVVCGGGNSAATDALYLSKICKKVYLVHRRENLRAAAVYERALTESGAEIVWNTRIVEILHGNYVTGVKIENVKTGVTGEIGCEGLFVAIGRAPETELFKGQIELDENGYIVAGESTKTSLPGVFAVGDVRTKPLRQIITAAADGAVASHFAEEYLKLKNAVIL